VRRRRADGRERRLWVLDSTGGCNGLMKSFSGRFVV
jgi:hypothetical protein